MSAYKLSSPVSAVPNISWLTWLYKKGYLTTICHETNYWLNSFAYTSLSERDILDSYEDVGLRIDLLGVKVNSIDFSSAFQEIVYRSLDRAGDYDPTCLAEFLLDWPKQIVLANHQNLNEIFINNWKFSRFMRNRSAAIFASISYLINPLVAPLDTAYSYLVASIRGFFDGRSSLSLVEIKSRLSLLGVEIDGVFLESILLNEEVFLCLHTDAENKFVDIEKYFVGLDLAIELFDKREYVKINGLGYDSIEFDGVSIFPTLTPLKRFFNIHNKNINWSMIDPLEFSLKLRSKQSADIKYIQNIPSSLHRFIIDWITKNRSVWMSRNSRRVLGKKYLFKAQDIPPGRLLVYGNIKFSSEPERLALALTDMVSESIQERGLIHPSKIMTPFTVPSFSETTLDIDLLLSKYSLYEKYYIFSVHDLGMIVLRLNGLQYKPYSHFLAVAHIEDNITDSFIHIGRGIYADIDMYSGLSNVEKFRDRRAYVCNLVLPQNMSFTDYSSHIDEADRELLSKLVA